MPWVRLDDEFYDHRKVADLDPAVMLACIGLHTLALCWCNHNLTDGVVPVNQVFRLAGDLSLAVPSGSPRELIDELVRVGMWEIHECDERGRATSFAIHDYLDYQPSRARHEADIRRKSEGGKKGMASRWGAKPETRTDSGFDKSSNNPTNKRTNNSAITRARTRARNNPSDIITDPSGSTHVSPAEKSSAEDVPVENSPAADEFADVDFGEDEDLAADVEDEGPQEPPSPKRGKRASGPSPPPVTELVALYHEHCPSLPRVLKAEGARRDRLVRAHAQMGREGLADYFRRVEASDFLAGRAKEWRADLDWILKPANMQRILEGVHDNRAPAKKVRSGVATALALVRQHEEEEAGREAL